MLNKSATGAVLVAISLYVSASTVTTFGATASLPTSTSSSTSIPTTTTVRVPPPPPPPPPTLPPPVQVTPPSTTIITPPPPNYINPIPTPIDVTHAYPSDTNSSLLLGTMTIGADPITGLGVLNKFPTADNLKGPTDFILVQKQTESDVTQRETPYLVTLVNGTVLASVRKPSQMGMLHTAAGDVAFTANSDAFVSFNNGTLRVRNVDGMKGSIKVRLNTGPGKGHSYTVAPGFELVLGDHKLNREDFRPQDGIMRRRSRTIEGGYGGVAQYYVESALRSSALVTKMTQQEDNDPKARRILSDMSRMAAVLNHVNGTQGYSNQ